MKSRFVVFGMLFGFVLSRAGATQFDAILGMFRLTDLHLFGVIGAAVAVSALGFWAFRAGLWGVRTGGPATITPKPMASGLLMGGLVFGVGWAITGTCPGTALAQIGEGHLAGAFTFVGVLFGAWLRGQLARSTTKATPAPLRTPALAKLFR